MNDLDILLEYLDDLDDLEICRGLADELEYQGHEHAKDVRRLADAVPVFPAGRPRWLVDVARPDEDGATCRMEAGDPDRPSEFAGLLDPERYPEILPMALGEWWTIGLQPNGVFARLHADTPQREKVWRTIDAGIAADQRALALARGRLMLASDEVGIEPWWLDLTKGYIGYFLDVAGREAEEGRPTEEEIRVAFDDTRRVLIGALLGRRLPSDPARGMWIVGLRSRRPAVGSEHEGARPKTSGATA